MNLVTTLVKVHSHFLPFYNSNKFKIDVHVFVQSYMYTSHTVVHVQARTYTYAQLSFVCASHEKQVRHLISVVGRESVDTQQSPSKLNKYQAN